MSHRPGLPGGPPRGNRGPAPVPARSKSKRLRTKRERDAAKFGPKVPSGGSRRGPAAPPRRPRAPPRGGLASASPPGPPKAAAITENRLCHRGLFNREVKSLDVRRPPTPGPSGDRPPPAPAIEAGEVGGLPAEALKELAASLASLLGSFGTFLGRDLASERRRSLAAALEKHRRRPPDPGVFPARRTPARPPGRETPRVPRREARPGRPGRAVSLGGWEAGDPPAGTPGPPRAVRTSPPPPRAPSPIFGAPSEWENPFSWSSAEEDETPGGLTRTWGGPGGLPPGTPPFWRSPRPPQGEEEEGGDESWTPIAPPVFGPDPPPWGAPRSGESRGPPRAPRPPRTPDIWMTEAPWDPSDPPRDASRPPWDSPGLPRTPPGLLWEVLDPARAPPTPAGPSRAPRIWSPEPRGAPPDLPGGLWETPTSPGPPRDPGPRSPDPPRAAPGRLGPPRIPRLWDPERTGAPPDAPRPRRDPPRPPRERQDVPRLLWDSPDPPRALLDPLGSPGTPVLRSPERRGAPRHPEPRRCRCRRLRREAARHDPLRRHAVLRSPEPRWDPPAPPGAPRDLRPRSPASRGTPRDPEPWPCHRHRLRRDAARHDPLRRYAVHRDPPRRDAFRRASPCRDSPRCGHRAPQRRRPDRGGVGGGTRGGPGEGPPSPLLPSGRGCPRCERAAREATGPF